MARRCVVCEQFKEIETERLRKLETDALAEKGSHSMVRLAARIVGIAIETADMLVNEILSRHLRGAKRSYAMLALLAASAWRFALLFGRGATGLQ